MRQTLGVVLRDVLKLFHPAIPFVTEELWSHMADGEEMLVTSSWPEVPKYSAPAHVDTLQDLVTEVRRFRSQHQIPRKVDVPVTIVAQDEPLPGWWLAQLAALADCSPVNGDRPDSTAGHTRMYSSGVEAFVSLEGLIDVEAERPRIQKLISELEASIGRSQAKLNNPNFRDRAPAEVVAQEEDRLAVVETELAEQQRQLEELG